jgi:N6-L-threonylcarbamoyladenine synthase
MLVLGIETSCDETAAAVVKDGRQILSSVVTSSLILHKRYGGIIPEIAFRKQSEVIACVVDSALRESRTKLKNIDLVSVTRGPGLLGSLLVGISFAKSLGLGSGVPILGVNHLHSHIYACLLQPQKTQNNRKDGKEEINPPFVGLVVSGGHTSLFYVKDFDAITLMGSTRDDACGEAFDKVAKILGLGYPGGPIIERMARSGRFLDGTRFSCSGTDKPLDFSYSGIKDIAFSFQEAAFDVLLKKSILACKNKKTNVLVVGGGVAANNRLRQAFYEEAGNNNINVHFPLLPLCMDNAAMVAGLGYKLFKKGKFSGLNLDADLN